MNIILAYDGHTARLTLARPDKLNPLDWRTVRELRAAMGEIEERKEISFVVVTGQGRSFSAGGDLEGYLDHAIPEGRRGIMPPHSKHGVSGPELMELMRQQAVNFGTRIVTDDVTEVDLQRRPFVVRTLEGQTHEAHSLIIATGAKGYAAVISAPAR